jgi:hypothetical protein
LKQNGTAELFQNGRNTGEIANKGEKVVFGANKASIISQQTVMYPTNKKEELT